MPNIKKKLTGRRSATKPQPHLELRVIGPEIHTGRIPVPELLILCQHVQSAVERQAEALEGRQTLRPGPTSQKVVAECTLELVSLSSGSAVLAFEPASHQRHLPGVRNLAMEAIGGVVQSIDALAKDRKVEIDPGVLDSLNGLGGVFGRRVKTIHWSAAIPGQKRRLKAAFNAGVHKKVERKLRPPSTEAVAIDGVLEMADFKPGDHKCRLHPTMGPTVTCMFGPELADQIYSVLRQAVRIEGRGTFNPNSKKLESIALDSVEPLTPLSVNSGSFFTGWSLDQLVQMQAVDPMRDPKALSGGWPDDEDVDDLLDEIYQSRH